MDNDVDDDCDGATDDDVRRDGGQRRRDVNGDGAMGVNDNDDGNHGLGAQPLLSSSLPTPRPVGGLTVGLL